MWVRQTLFVLIGLGWGLTSHLQAAPCLRITGVVEDQSTHQPLDAQFYVKNQNARVQLGKSAAGSGQFSVDVPCSASILFIERTGYRPQQLRLNTPVSASDRDPVTVIIPLTAVDPLAIDKPYLQTEQAHYEQSQPINGGHWKHHNEFTVEDAHSGQALVARVCFFFTKSGRKTCRDTQAGGQVRISFPEKDIVAMEITATDYQSYQGNLIIEKPTVDRLHHRIRLIRELTLLSARLNTPGNVELRSLDSDEPISLRTVPEQPNLVLTCQALPRLYKLVVYDSNHAVRKQRIIQLKVGLNGLNINDVIDPASMPISSFTADSLTTLYFDQGSYTLRPETKIILSRVVTRLANNSVQRIQLVGHADPEGDPRLNYSLAEYRVKVVSTFLCSQGVREQQIELISYGSRYPVAPSDTETNKARNRRVQIHFIP